MSTEASTTTTATSAVSIKACPKCGRIKKSGKLSCCARGGAWFKNCGDVRESKFHHTWVEGMQACKKFVISNLINSPALIMFRHERINGYPRNNSHQHNEIYPTERLSDVDTMNSEDCVEVSKVVMCIFMLFISLHLQL